MRRVEEARWKQSGRKKRKKIEKKTATAATTTDHKNINLLENNPQYIMFSFNNKQHGMQQPTPIPNVFINNRTDDGMSNWHLKGMEPVLFASDGIGFKLPVECSPPWRISHFRCRHTPIHPHAVFQFHNSFVFRKKKNRGKMEKSWKKISKRNGTNARGKAEKNPTPKDIQLRSSPFI